MLLILKTLLFSRPKKLRKDLAAAVDSIALTSTQVFASPIASHQFSLTPSLGLSPSNVKRYELSLMFLFFLPRKVVTTATSKGRSSQKCARNLRLAPPQQKFGEKFESSASVVKAARTVTYETEARVERRKTFRKISAMAARVLTSKRTQLEASRIYE